MATTVEQGAKVKKYTVASYSSAPVQDAVTPLDCESDSEAESSESDDQSLAGQVEVILNDYLVTIQIHHMDL